MIDFLIQLLDSNINFQSIGIFLLLYCFSIWILLCFWVFVDAKKRYEKTLTGIIFFFIVLVFNFPGLIFYLIIRPEGKEDNFFYLQGNDTLTEAGRIQEGVSVPIVNFTDENGEVNLTFQLKFNKSAESEMQDKNFQLDIDLPKDKSIEVIQPVEQPMEKEIVQVMEEKVEPERVGFLSVLSGTFTKIKNLPKRRSNKVERVKENTEREETNNIKSAKSSKSEENTSKKHKKNKSKKKRR